MEESFLLQNVTLMRQMPNNMASQTLTTSVESIAATMEKATLFLMVF